MLQDAPMYSRRKAEVTRREVREVRHAGHGRNDISTAGGAKAAWFKDTEGNIMAIIQSL